MSDEQLLDLVLGLQLAASATMLGVIWLVQRLVYPSFATIAEHDWSEYHDTHTSRITPIVLPAMVVELAAATGLAIARPSELPIGLVLINLVLAVATWGMTARVVARFHTPLARGHDPAGCARLVTANRARTFVWTVRVPICIALVVAAS